MTLFKFAAVTNLKPVAQRIKRQLWADAPPALDLAALDVRKLPILNADALLQLLNQHNRLRTIQTLVSIDHKRYDTLYLEPIYRFCELAQLMPASANYHHTGPGGLIVHTLAVIEAALRERQRFVLPAQSDPEIIQRQRHVWTYGVFVAGLLHDAGKLVTLCAFITDQQQRHSPYHNALCDQKKTEHYQLTFLNAPYQLHQRLSSSFFYLIPATGRAFLGQHPEILAQISAYWLHDPYAWGSIGEIVGQADQMTVADDLQLAQKRRFPNAPKPLVERLMTALRQAIREGVLPINRPGAAIWKQGATTYLVSKTAADVMRETLEAAGATDIPRDNLRIFDELQQFQFIRPTLDQRAIWRIAVDLPAQNFHHTFTVLKFETAMLFHPRQDPADINGTLLEQVDEAEATTRAPDAVDQPKPTDEQPTESAETEKQPVTAPAMENTDAARQVETKPQLPATKTTPTAESSTESQPAVVTKTQADETPAEANGENIPEPSKAMGEDFIQWLRQQVVEKKTKLNVGLVHVVPYTDQQGVRQEVAGVVSPHAFAEYARAQGIVTGKKKDFERVQTSVHKLKTNIRNGRFQIHTYRLSRSASANVKLQFYLWPKDVMIPAEMDAPLNESLEPIKRKTKPLKEA